MPNGLSPETSTPYSDPKGLRRVRPSTVHPPRGTLKAGRLGEIIGPQSHLKNIGNPPKLQPTLFTLYLTSLP